MARRSARLRQLKPNPPWAEDLLVSTYQALLESKQIPGSWLPMLTDLERAGTKISGRFREFGCGVYGCVYPTMDDAVVLKVTTDDTEMDFAVNHAGTLVAPVCVTYHTAFKTDQIHKQRPISLLWRESAYDVGQLSDIAEANWGSGRMAIKLINAQWDAAQKALHAVVDERDATDPLAEWTSWLEEMTLQDDVPSLQPLATGMLKIYREQHIFFGDVHMGNLGCVDRLGQPEWVITDPGNIIVFDE